MSDEPQSGVDEQETGSAVSPDGHDLRSPPALDGQLVLASAPEGETASLAVSTAADGARDEAAEQVSEARLRLSEEPQALALLEHQLEHGHGVSRAAKELGIDYYTALRLSRQDAYRLVLHHDLESTREHAVGEATRILLHLASTAKSESVRRQAASDLLKRNHSARSALGTSFTLSIKL